MSNLDEHGRPKPPPVAGEIESLIGFLEWQRSTLEWKTHGVGQAGLASKTASSSMTLGGILKHMAFVEDHWFRYRLLGLQRTSLWLSVDWDTDPDWEWTSAANDSADELRAMWAAAVQRSRDDVEEALLGGGLDQLARRASDDGVTPSLRWILIHMIEEYARHNGHADLLREALDGQVGE